MTVSSTPLILPPVAEDNVLKLYKQYQSTMNLQWDVRAKFRERDLLYSRETDRTEDNIEAKARNKLGDANAYQNITVPIVMPQVESAVVYQASVFLTGKPLFGMVASPENQDAATQMETVTDVAAQRGGWTRQFSMFFRDAFKYNISFLLVDWCRETVPVLETDITFSSKEGKPKELIWEGNIVKRLDPYNTFWDTRVPPAELHTRGEFVGYTELISHVELKQYFSSLPDKRTSNERQAFESGTSGLGGITSGLSYGYYIPDINPDGTLDKSNSGSTTNWAAWMGMAPSSIDNNKAINYKSVYERTTVYCRIIPSTLGIKIPSPNTVQIFKLVFINHSVLVYCERQTNAHNYLPVLVGQPNEDGLHYQTKSLVDNVAPMQSVASSLMNGAIHARRRALTDRVIFDPSRISARHINSSNPSAKIPTRPAAYGRPPGESVYAFPFRDDQSGIALQEINQIKAMADMASGNNPVRQGQFVKGNKTRAEFGEVMANANGRDELTALLFEAQVFTPLKLILKTNILQYQGADTLYNPEQKKTVKIDPVKLRAAIIDFKMTDGKEPSSKVISSDILTVALQTMQSVPQIGAGYNPTELFSYLMKTQGADLKSFEKAKEQIAYEQALGNWQQMVSMVTAQIKGEVTVDQVATIMKQLPPQPVPKDYGYNPAGEGATDTAGDAGEGQADQTKDANGG
jgi:hypothetical protein